MINSITNKNGQFALNTDENYDSIVLSAPGFETIGLRYSGLSDTILLIHSKELLDEVEVRPLKKDKISYLGEKKLWKSYRMTDYSHFKKVVLIENSFNEIKKIKSLECPVLKDYSHFPYIQVFIYSNVNNRPEKLLFEDTIYLEEKGRRITIRINLNSDNLYLPKEGLFIGLDWINTGLRGQDYSDSSIANIITTYKTRFEVNNWNRVWVQSEHTKGGWMDYNKIWQSDENGSYIPVMGLNVYE